MTKTEEHLFTVAVLLDELKHEEVSHRLESMRNLRVIAEALGPDRTRTELVPFLADSLDDDDEVLLVLAGELGAFAPLVGGPQHAGALLAPLEQLAMTEEATVREKAVQSLVALSQLMAEGDVNGAFMALVKTLAHKDWFTARTSACALIGSTYRLVNSSGKGELRQWFLALCKDDTPMVRRAAAQALAQVAGVVEPEFAKNDLMGVFSHFAGDEQDSVRLLAIQGGVALAKVVGPAASDKTLLPQMLTLAGDKSWRVRWSVANAFKELVQTLEKDMHGKLLEAFIALLKDNEAEVRSAAGGNMTHMAKAFSGDVVVGQLVPVIGQLAKDANEHVREALAGNVMGVAPIVGKDRAVDQLLPIYHQLLKDENAQVRLAVIADLGSAKGVIGVDLLSSSLLPAIVNLSEERNWRVRAKVIEHIGDLASQLDVGYFDKNLVDLCLGWLADKVFAIREAACANLIKLVGVYGKPWARAKILPRVVELKSHHHYLYRLTAISTAEALIPVLDAADAEQTLVPLIVSLAADRVPNCRFAVAKALERLAGASPQVVDKQETVKSCLKALAMDTDLDVKYYGRRAARKVEAF